MSTPNPTTHTYIYSKPHNAHLHLLQTPQCTPNSTPNPTIHTYIYSKTHNTHLHLLQTPQYTPTSTPNRTIHTYIYSTHTSSLTSLRIEGFSFIDLNRVPMMIQRSPGQISDNFFMRTSPPSGTFSKLQ